MTQHHHTPPPDPMPLDPEERALAARLARLGPHGEPSPALDARVLAAAHAATAGGVGGARAGARGERGWRRARWPVGAGLAASVVLASLVAWELRPLPAAVVPREEATVAVRASDDARFTAPAPPVARAQPSPIPPAETAAPTTPAAVALQATDAAPAPAAARATMAAKVSVPEAPPIVFDEPAAVDVQAPPPPPPAPPAPIAAAPAPPAPTVQQAPPVSEAADADAPEGDVPPATAASPAVRDAWLARIRELAAAGRSDEARASLAEFRRRYPAFAIPEDLRPLLPP